MKKNIVVFFTVCLGMLIMYGCNKKEVETFKTASISALLRANNDQLAQGGPYYLDGLTRADDVMWVEMDGHKLPYISSNGDYNYYDVSNNGAIYFYARAAEGYIWVHDFSQTYSVRYRVRQ